jgi:hypothetical protein
MFGLEWRGNGEFRAKELGSGMEMRNQEIKHTT